ncbi:Kelch repeat-containing protein [Marinicella rhabdoformis]|uniref:Kelch repeat-containing protein n=1 Tax=Marinicella rhabdoformis TaxID=2580566 RepID=UPI0015D09A8D|nr:kelch repeat-containing protein [Marinicella rhabdoformis]
MKQALLSCLYLFLLACSGHQPASHLKTFSIHTQISHLPYPVSNHAVAQTAYQGEVQFFFFNGLTNDKTHADVTNKAWVWREKQWQALTVPNSQPAVLASVAASVNNQVYLFGGYTVAADGSEKSSPLVWRIDGDTLEWRAMPEMPTPVDDSVALVFQNRYIYLVSGWHDVDNVDLVQVFDTLENTWQQATPFPIPAVFGHAAAIVGNQMLVCDGVKVIWESESKKRFEASPVCALGAIDENDITQINWQDINHYSGVAHYRMAAASDNHFAVFVGGSDNPYNYNGIGYDGVPSQASSGIRVFDFNTKTWQSNDNQLSPNMDHRGLLKAHDEFIILGGMKTDQELSPHIIKFNIKSLN